MKKTVLPLLICASFLFGGDAKPPAEKSKAPDTVTGVTLTVGQLLVLGSSPTLTQIASEKLPVNMAFRIKRIIDTLKPEVERAIQERNGLFTEQNSTLRADGLREIKPDKKEELQKSLDLLAQEKVQVAIVPLVLEEDLPGVKLSAQDIESLGPLIHEKK